MDCKRDVRTQESLFLQSQGDLYDPRRGKSEAKKGQDGVVLHPPGYLILHLQLLGSTNGKPLNTCPSLLSNPPFLTRAKCVMNEGRQEPSVSRLISILEHGGERSRDVSLLISLLIPKYGIILEWQIRVTPETISAHLKVNDIKLAMHSNDPSSFTFRFKDALCLV
jgi:hypothetical protein